jgi:hypothetical protein
MIRNDIIAAIKFIEDNGLSYSVEVLSVCCAFLEENTNFELKDKINVCINNGTRLNDNFMKILFYKTFVAPSVDLNDVQESLNVIDEMIESVSEIHKENKKINSNIEQKLSEVALENPVLHVAIAEIRESVDSLMVNYSSEIKAFESFINKAKRIKLKLSESILSKNIDYLTGLGNIEYQRFIMNEIKKELHLENKYFALITLKNYKDYEGNKTLYFSVIREIKKMLEPITHKSFITRVDHNKFMINFCSGNFSLVSDFITKLVSELEKKNLIYKGNNERISNLKLNVVFYELRQEDECDIVLDEMFKHSNVGHRFLKKFKNDTVFLSFRRV